MLWMISRIRAFSLSSRIPDSANNHKNNKKKNHSSVVRKIHGAHPQVHCAAFYHRQILFRSHFDYIQKCYLLSKASSTKWDPDREHESSHNFSHLEVILSASTLKTEREAFLDSCVFQECLQPCPLQSPAWHNPLLDLLRIWKPYYTHSGGFTWTN